MTIDNKSAAAEPQVSDLLGRYLNTMVSDLKIEGRGQYLRELFSRYEEAAEADSRTLREALEEIAAQLNGLEGRSYKWIRNRALAALGKSTGKKGA